MSVTEDKPVPLLTPAPDPVRLNETANPPVLRGLPARSVAVSVTVAVDPETTEEGETEMDEA